jgi:hypothetical protein
MHSSLSCSVSVSPCSVAVSSYVCLASSVLWMSASCYNATMPSSLYNMCGHDGIFASADETAIDEAIQDKDAG